MEFLIPGGIKTTVIYAFYGFLSFFFSVSCFESAK